MKFNNRGNWFIEQDEKIYWISRSVAVLPILIFVVSESDGDSVFVPLGKRGLDLPDEVGKWSLAGGYLDWDETAGEAVIRETYEELGLDLLSLRDRAESAEENSCLKFQGDMEQPYFVYSIPTLKQNVTLHFPLMFWVEELPQLCPQVSTGEVEEARWFDLDNALGSELAFGHQETIRHCLINYFGWQLD